MSIEARGITAEELLRRPDDGSRYELIRGELHEMAPAGSEHGAIAFNLGRLLGNHVAKGELGQVYAAETGFKISSSPDTVRAPDVAFVARERVDAAGKVTGYWPGAPDLAVEVVSPNDVHTEVVEKSLSWLEAGCRTVLVVDPGQRTVTVYRSLEDIRILRAEAGDAIDGGEVVPDWRLPLTELFA
jgi:Uma2 family endonuclease